MAQRSAMEWQALFEVQARSGSSAAEFCREHKVSPKYFYSLRKRFGQMAATVKPSPFVRLEMEAAPTFPAQEIQARLRLGRCEWEVNGLSLGNLVHLMQALA